MGIDYRQARSKMVSNQLKGREVKNRRVLDAFLSTPRHDFVETALAGQAYSDRSLPIGHGQTISQPYMVGVMTEALNPQPDNRILEIGTGSGYQTAILAQLTRSVFTVERLAPLAERARSIFSRLELTNIIQRVGDGTLGWKQYAPFDGIIVTAGAPDIPNTLLDQLAEGGRLIIPTGPRNRQILTVITRYGDEFQTTDDIACVFVPLIGEEGWSDD